jgi:hypothetical protein
VTAPPVAALRFDARVPPRLAGGCDAATQERVVALREREGNFTDTLRRNKKFGNPYLLRQVVEHFKIDETGSNFVAPAASGSSGSGSARFAPECFVDHLRKLRAAAVAGASLPQRQPKPQPQLQLQRPTSGAVAAAAASAGVLPPPSNAPPRKRSRCRGRRTLRLTSIQKRPGACGVEALQRSPRPPPKLKRCAGGGGACPRGLGSSAERFTKCDCAYVRVV